MVTLGVGTCLKDVAVIGLDEKVFLNYQISDINKVLDTKDKRTITNGLKQHIREDDFILEYSMSKCDQRCIAPFFRNDQGNLEGFPKEVPMISTYVWLGGERYQS